MGCAKKYGPLQKKFAVAGENRHMGIPFRKNKSPEDSNEPSGGLHTDGGMEARRIQSGIVCTSCPYIRMKYTMDKQ